MKRKRWTAVSSLLLLITLVAVAFPAGVGAAERFPEQIRLPDGKWLIVVNSTLGTLYRVDPDTGEATEIDLGGESVTNGDGILLQGKTLYVLRNQLNEIAEIQLSPDLSSGTLSDTITDEKFDVPTTLALFGSRLYAVNARFNTPPTPTTEYSIVQVER